MMLYALLATAIGSVLGVLLGESTIPLLTVNTYKLVYIGLHNTVVKPDVFDALLASLLAIYLYDRSDAGCVLSRAELIAGTADAPRGTEGGQTHTSRKSRIYLEAPQLRTEGGLQKPVQI